MTIVRQNRPRIDSNFIFFVKPVTLISITEFSGKNK